MMLSTITLLLTLSLLSSASSWKLSALRRRQTASSDDTDPPMVPSFNISIPVDHFNASNTRTYNNRYWVNDTFYAPGGPVILYDFGENGVSDSVAAIYLAEWNDTISAPVQLAQRLNGLVVGWEHRYYGTSLPVPTNTSLLALSIEETWEYNLPDGGVSGYQWLTVEQALEDVVYFANHFGEIRASPNLGPDQTPWIWVGASYPGSRGAWIRERNPEVIYATWASSATVQTELSAAAYTNPIYRGLPSNCTSDIQAAVNYTNSILASDDEDAITFLKLQVLAMEGDGDVGSEDALAQAQNLTAFQIGAFMATSIWYGAQYLGIPNSTQLFCDYLEQWSVEAYSSSVATYGGASNATAALLAMSSNPDDADPQAEGQATSYNATVAWQAYLYAGQRWLQEYLLGDIEYISSSEPNAYADIHAWQWQQLVELGAFMGSNSSDPLTLMSQFYNVTAVHDEVVTHYFPSLDPSDIPDTPDVQNTLQYGGWGMTPSNVMFTNGEFDPWRAYGVASQEQAYGAPVRTHTQNPPACNEVLNGMDVFGIVYPGATHGEDMRRGPFGGGSTNMTDPPIDMGVALFMRALDSWLPCFNDTRRNGPNSTYPSSSPSSSSSSTSSPAPTTGAASRSHAGGFVAVGAIALLFAVVM